jgi:hypothetical protein
MSYPSVHVTRTAFSIDGPRNSWTLLPSRLMRHGELRNRG